MSVAGSQGASSVEADGDVIPSVATTSRGTAGLAAMAEPVPARAIAPRDVHLISGFVTVGEDLAGKLRRTRRIGGEGGLEDVVVRVVAGAPHAAAPPATPLLLTVYELSAPHQIRIVAAGRPIVVENSGVDARTVRVTRGTTELFDELVGAHARSPTINFPSGLEPARIDTRERPEGALVVVPVDNSFRSITNEAGRFSLNDLPPGTFTVEAWDDDLGTLTQKVMVPSPVGWSLRFQFGSGPPAKERSPFECRIATRGPIADACKTGGQDAAVKLMKDLVKRAKAKGAKYTCDGCHKDLDTYALVEGARDKLETLQALVASP